MGVIMVTLHKRDFQSEDLNISTLAFSFFELVQAQKALKSDSKAEVTFWAWIEKKLASYRGHSETQKATSGKK
jgi:hypothetical protein